MPISERLKAYIYTCDVCGEEYVHESDAEMAEGMPPNWCVVNRQEIGRVLKLLLCHNCMMNFDRMLTELMKQRAPTSSNEWEPDDWESLAEQMGQARAAQVAEVED